MATRKIAPVGSLTWIADERTTAQQLEEQDVEIIAYAVRNDMEWLNEHMANIFERNVFDMAEIMKTPGRLRGNPAQSVRKQQIVVEPLSDIFTDDTAAKTTTLVHRFQEAIAATTAAASSSSSSSPHKLFTSPPPPPQPQFLPPPSLPQPQSLGGSSPGRSPTKSSPPKPSSPPKLDSPVRSPIKETTIRPPPPRQPPAAAPPPPPPSPPPPSFSDSGFFTSSNPNSQAEHLLSKLSSWGSRDSTEAAVPLDHERPSASNEEAAASGNSFTTAQEDLSLQLPPSSPADDQVALVRSRSPEKGKEQQHRRQAPDRVQDLPVRDPSPAKTKAMPASTETRRSGRLASRASQSSAAAAQSSPAPEASLDLRPKSTAETASAAATEDAPLYPTLPEPDTATEPQQDPSSDSKPSQSQSGDSFGADGEPELHSETPIPEAPLVRQSSMNFAPLPAREPLTNKKKSLGAKAMRESQLDQLKQNGSQRASWMNKKGNGKSLGGSSRSIVPRNVDEGEVEGAGEGEGVGVGVGAGVGVGEGEDKNAEAPQPPPKTGEKRKSESGSSSRWRKKSRGEDVVGVVVQETTKVPTKGGDYNDSDADLRQHNKTSTQRLHDKISQLGKHNARNARSFPASVPQTNNPAYPDLAACSQEPAPATSAAKKSLAEPQPEPADIGGATGQVASRADGGDATRAPKPPLARSKTDGVVVASSDAVDQQEPIRRTSPRRPSPVKSQTQPSPLASSARAFFERTEQAGSSPIGRSAMSPPLSPLKTVSYASISDVPQFAAKGGQTSPQKTAVAATDHILSAAKAHRDTLASKAREIWARTATSVSAKAETMHSPPLRKWQGAESLQDVFRRDAVPGRAPDPPKSPRERQELYPDLSSVLSSGKAKDDRVGAPAASPVIEALREGRQTRGSRSNSETAAPAQPKPASSGRLTRSSKSAEEVRAEVAPSQPAPPPPTAPKAVAKKKDEDEDLQAKIERQKRLEEILRIEKQMLERMKQSQLADSQRLKEQPPQEFSDGEEEEELEPEPETSRSRLNSAEPERPPSRLQQRGAGGLRFQKVEPKRTGTQPKDQQQQPSGKPAPVSIKIGTASQREMQDQRNKTINAAGPTGSALVSALKSSFEPSLPTMNPTSAPSRGNHHGLRTSSSNGSVRSVISSANSTKQLKSLQSAASQRKKEQEDRERKAAQKRELERRRVDNQRRQDEEHKRMQAQRQKNNTTPGPNATKSGARVQPPGSLRGNSQEPETNKKPYGSLNKVPYGSSKRVMPQGPEEPQSRHVPGGPGAPASYHQEGPKKRRTNDHEERSYEMPPPIRASMQKKVDSSVVPPKGTLVSMELHPLTTHNKKELAPKPLGHGYTSQASFSSATSTIKASSSKVPQVESVKFSKEKIKFAGETPGGAAAPAVPAPAASSSSSTFKTPGTTKAGKKSKNPAAFKESPLYPNGESIVLPEIPTDSEDEDDDYSSKKPELPRPQWAESPELRELLRKQQAMDPTEVFGPMARLDMEAIFQTDKKQGKFRTRTSSANWGGSDRLTQTEILADQEARRKMMETGKWTLPGL